MDKPHKRERERERERKIFTLLRECRQALMVLTGVES
jgi:hypothetical protein